MLKFKSTYGVTSLGYKAKKVVWKKPIIAFGKIKNKNSNFEKRKEPNVNILNINEKGIFWFYYFGFFKPMETILHYHMT